MYLLYNNCSINISLISLKENCGIVICHWNSRSRFFFFYLHRDLLIAKIKVAKKPLQRCNLIILLKNDGVFIISYTVIIKYFMFYRLIIAFLRLVILKKVYIIHKPKWLISFFVFFKILVLNFTNTIISMTYYFIYFLYR